MHLGTGIGQAIAQFLKLGDIQPLVVHHDEVRASVQSFDVLFCD